MAGMGLSVGDHALLHGYRVIVECVRRVTGGVAVDVRRHPSAHGWPWTVSSFTTNADHLVKVPVIP